MTKNQEAEDQIKILQDDIRIYKEQIEDLEKKLKSNEKPRKNSYGEVTFSNASVSEEEYLKLKQVFFFFVSIHFEFFKNNFFFQKQINIKGASRTKKSSRKYDCNTKKPNR